jgi:hypothetical protein
VTTLSAAALRYAERGWPVFPCAGKRPITAHGLHDATVDPGLVAGWWEQWPDANVGVRTGDASRLVVLDVDGDDGNESLRRLEAEHVQLPRTLSVVTPRGGAHLYFRHPGATVRNSAGALGHGLDVRGDGGYVIAPPSTGPNGRRYEPDERAPIAGMPGWLRQLLAGADAGGARPRTCVSEWGVGIVRDGLPEGERNTGLARLVGHLLARDVNAHLVAEIAHLVNARARPPLDAGEVDRVVESIAGREIRRRRGGRA